MRLLIARRDFLAAARLAGLVTPTRIPKPILRNIKLITTESTWSLTGNNQEAAVRTVRILPSDVAAEPGGVLLPPRLIAAVSADASETVEIASAPQGVSTAMDHGQFTLNTEAVDEFPEPDFECPGPQIDLSATALAEGLKRAALASNHGWCRLYVLDGVRIEAENSMVTLVGFDGKQIGIQRIGASVPTDMPKSAVIIPETSAHLLAKLCTEDNVLVSWGDSSFVAVTSSATFRSSLISGRYPKWREGLNGFGEPKAECDVQVELFAATLSQAICLQGSEVEDRCVKIRIGDGAVRVSNESPEIGEGSFDVPVAYDGEPVSMPVQGRCLVAPLRRLSGVVKLQLLTEQVAIIADDGYQYFLQRLLERPGK